MSQQKITLAELHKAHERFATLRTKFIVQTAKKDKTGLKSALAKVRNDYVNKYYTPLYENR